MAARPDEGLIWIREHVRFREFDQPAIVHDEFLGFEGWKPLRVKQQIFFHFILHNFRKYKSAKPGRAK